MAHCPQCRGEMDASEIVCPHCGYDFPLADSGSQQGFAYSGFADVALLVGLAVSALVAILRGVQAVGAAMHGNWGLGFVHVLETLMYFTLCVVFARVADLKKS